MTRASLARQAKAVHKAFGSGCALNEGQVSTLRSSLLALRERLSG